MKGTFITLEGPEGGGKTTQAMRLVKRLREAGIDVVAVREPGGTPTGEIIRDILQHNSSGEPIAARSEALLFAASRAQLVDTTILPALERGSCVVCDRFADSTTAYQGYGRCLGVEAMLGINSFAVDRAVPDLTLLLDIDVVQGLERVGRRNALGSAGKDTIERENIEVHERIRAGYLELAKRFPERIKVINTAGGEDSVAEEVWRHVEHAVECGGRQGGRGDGK